MVSVGWNIDSYIICIPFLAVLDCLKFVFGAVLFIDIIAKNQDNFEYEM